MLKLIGTLVLAYALLTAGLYLLQRRILYVPDRRVPDRLAAGVSEMREVWIETEDGLRLRSWYHPAGEGRPTVIYFHGNGGNIEGRGTKARHFLDAGYGLLLLGYRGYGGNEGSPSEDGFTLDARGAVSFARGQGVSPSNLVLYGESLGTGLAVRMAGEGPTAAIVLEAPYTSIVDVAAAAYWYVPARLLLKDRFELVSRLDAVSAPLLVVHGSLDRVIPISHGRAVFAAAGDPKSFAEIPDGGHNNLFYVGGFDAVDRFLQVHSAKMLK